jgi:hypothetical protein
MDLHVSDIFILIEAAKDTADCFILTSGKSYRKEALNKRAL